MRVCHGHEGVCYVMWIVHFCKHCSFIHTYMHACMHAYMHTCIHTYIHTYILTLDNMHSSQAQGLNLRRRRSLGGTRTHTHTRLMALFPGLPRWAGTRKVKPIWILLKQETISGSGISWDICKSAPHSRQITTPAPHRSVFYRPYALPAVQPTGQNTEGKGGTRTVDINDEQTDDFLNEIWMSWNCWKIRWIVVTDTCDSKVQRISEVVAESYIQCWV